MGVPKEDFATGENMIELVALAIALLTVIEIVHFDRVKCTLGVTAGTPGTAVSIAYGDDAVKTVALILNSAEHTPTTAEGHVGCMIAEANGWPWPLRFIIPPIVNSGPATNQFGYTCLQDVIPVELAGSPNMLVKFKGFASSTATVAPVVECGVLYAGDGGVSKRFLDRLRLLSALDPVTWMDYGYFTKGAATVANAENLIVTDPVAGIQLPGEVKEITAGRFVFYKHGAITASEEITGFVRFKSDISKLGPMDIPVNAISGTLGTPVGSGQWDNSIPWIPLDIENKSNGVRRLTPYAVTSIAVTANMGAAIALAGR